MRRRRPAPAPQTGDEDDDGILASDLWTNVCFVFLVAFAFAVEDARAPAPSSHAALARGEAKARPPVAVRVERDPSGALGLRVGDADAPLLVDAAALAERVALARAEDPGAAFVVTAGAEAAYGDLAEALARLASAGVAEVGLAPPAPVAP